MCKADSCVPFHQDSSGERAPARLTPCCCMECTRLEHVFVVLCSRAATFPSPTSRLACATCLKGMDGQLGIDPSHPFLRRTTSWLYTLRLKLVFYFDLSSSRGPSTPLRDGWVSAKLWTLRPVPHLFPLSAFPLPPASVCPRRIQL